MFKQGPLSEPDRRGRRWLQLDDCKIQLSAGEVRKYKVWRDTVDRNSRNSASTGQSSATDSSSIEGFFQTLAVSAPTSLEGSARSASPAHRMTSLKLREARIQLFEDNYLLDYAPAKLQVGQLDGPDSFGWRWYQCTESVQVLLPPDASTQYSAFLMLEESHLRGATNRRTVERYNRAREHFNELCLQSKYKHPVRGLVSSSHRYAIPAGFRCSSIDKLVGRPQDDCEFLTVEDVPTTTNELLSPPDEYCRRWLHFGHSRIILPADTAAQFAFFHRHDHYLGRSPMQDVLSDFRCLSSEIISEELHDYHHRPHGSGSGSASGFGTKPRPKLYMIPSGSHSQTLDEAVAQIEVKMARTVKKEVQNTTLNPGWKNVVQSLGEHVEFDQGFPPTPPTSYESQSQSQSPESIVLDLHDNEGKRSPGLVRRVAKRRGVRNLKVDSNREKELPPLPLEGEERDEDRTPIGFSESSTTLSARDRIGRVESLWLRRKVGG